MKHILILGATGMAGHVVYHYLKNSGKFKISNIVFRNKLTEDSIIADVTDKEEVTKAIIRINPDIVINCIGILVNESYKNPANAIYINAYLPHMLKQICDQTGSKLVHMSSDCVFSGKKGCYTEYDFRDADDIYGRTKALGEIINNKDLTIRTSIIGPELKENGEGLFHWFMHQKGKINGFKKAIWGGITTLELAKAIMYAIENETTGLIQISNSTGISKYDLLNLFKDIWNKDIIINPIDCHSSDRSILKSETFDHMIPGYKQMLNEQKQWMAGHPELYGRNY